MLTVMDSSVTKEIKKNTDIQNIKSIHAQILHTQKFAGHSNYVKLPGRRMDHKTYNRTHFESLLREGSKRGVFRPVRKLVQEKVGVKRLEKLGFGS